MNKKVKLLVLGYITVAQFAELSSNSIVFAKDLNERSKAEIMDNMSEEAMDKIVEHGDSLDKKLEVLEEESFIATESVIGNSEEILIQNQETSEKEAAEETSEISSLKENEQIKLESYDNEIVNIPDINLKK